MWLEYIFGRVARVVHRSANMFNVAVASSEAGLFRRGEIFFRDPLCHGVCSFRHGVLLSPQLGDEIRHAESFLRAVAHRTFCRHQHVDPIRNHRGDGQSIRLLHSKLCDMLRVFSSGYGGVLLCYFTFNFFDLLRNFYYLIHVSRYDFSSHPSSYYNTLNVILTVAFCLQSVVFVVCLLIGVSWINEKKIEIISFLRLIHISKLPIDTKLQVKMFMNQLSIFEWDQFSAFGFFHINLRLIMSIFILLTTTLATSVQMKEHPYVVRFNKAYQSYLRYEYNIN
ncbi:uncharacterized protein LOC107884112 [Acyrthosiphon pisum]|uniref:Gustatory receptor n=1 Tax=Acyrthosiphon pisum TaxID=7029 RepID=A0A8R2JN45_ACYPI|nr:uncharacterized protein LOC107884112 [Acyrthosiphon pisum]